MSLGDVKNCTAFFFYPYSEEFNFADHTVQTFAVVPRSDDECRQRISALCENFKKSEWPLNIRAEIKSINNQMDESVKRFVTRRVVYIYKASWGEQFWLALRSYPRSYWVSSSAPNTRSPGHDYLCKQ